MAVVTHLLPEGADLNDARALIKQHVEVTAGRIRAAAARRLGYTDLLDSEAGDVSSVIGAAFAKGAVATGDVPRF